MKPRLHRFPRIWRATRLARRWHHAHSAAYPDWTPLLASAGSSRNPPPGGGDRPRVLMATAIGSYAHAVTLESTLAVALSMRGADVHVLVCDESMPACAECEASLYPSLEHFERQGPGRDLCRQCREPAERVYRPVGATIHPLSASLTGEDAQRAAQLAREVPFDAVRTWQFEGIAAGEHAYAGALRFFASGSLDREPRAEAVLRRYLEAAMRTILAVRRLIRDEHYDAAVFTHGIYVPWGLIGEVARAERVRVVNWNVAYRKRCFIFSHGDTYHHTLMAEPPEVWETLDLSPEREQKLLRYLASRREGLFDWVVFHRRPKPRSAEQVRSAIGLDATKPVIGLLTNVTWDAQLHYPANAFPDMLDWLVRTCEYFAGRPDLQLLIRVHPAEISGFPRSRQPVLGELKRRLPRLPPNVFVVPPDSQLSTYLLMSFCNAAVIYGTKMGVELTSVGLPIIVAGEAWIRNKGITRDAQSAGDYFGLLDALPFPGRLPDDLVHRARQYAYHFFFRRMIPLPFMEPRTGYPIYRLKLDSLAPLRPGATPGLDVICAGILHGTPFIADEITSAASPSPALPSSPRPDSLSGAPLPARTAR